MAAVLLVSAFGFAQPKMNVVGLSGLDVQYKRCVVNGTSCYFDFVVTNVSSKISAGFDIQGYSVSGERVYLKLWDDEGNVLKGSRDECLVGNERGCCTYIPKDVPVKVRVPFTGIDEYATVFKLFQFPICFDNHEGYIELRNVPIVRRNQ